MLWLSVVFNYLIYNIRNISARHAAHAKILGTQKFWARKARRARKHFGHAGHAGTQGMQTFWARKARRHARHANILGTQARRHVGHVI